MSLEKMIVDEVCQSIKTDKTLEKVLLDKLAENGIFPNQRAIRIKMNKMKPAEIIPNQHFQFLSVLRSILAKVNLILVGPAGSGKTTIAKTASEVLKLKFFSKSVSGQTGIHEFFGYQDAHGNYVRTLFREAYEKGGVFLLDEFDAGNPNVLAAMNQATANGECAFPDKMVNKHKDFVLIMAGNTFGTGATAEYVGRNKIDAATLDRFAFIHIEYDEELEMLLTSNKDWCKKVQSFRKNATDKKVKCIISPRASFYGADLLESGLSEKEVASMLIFKSLSTEEVNLISQGITLSNTAAE